jgi:DNA-binding transcriptional regulator YiaG
MAKKKTMNNEHSSFENKLLSRLRSANARLRTVESLEELRPNLTVRRVKLNLEPRTISGEEIKTIRKAFSVSQAVFALFIQVPVRTLQEWEQGRSEIPGCAARLIGEMIHNPTYWRERLEDAFELAGS